MLSALRRVWVVAVAVAFADRAVGVVDEVFDLRRHRRVAPCGDRLRLRVERGENGVGAFELGRPAVAVRDSVNIRIWLWTISPNWLCGRSRPPVSLALRVRHDEIAPPHILSSWTCRGKDAGVAAKPIRLLRLPPDTRQILRYRRVGGLGQRQQPRLGSRIEGQGCCNAPGGKGRSAAGAIFTAREGIRISHSMDYGW